MNKSAWNIDRRKLRRGKTLASAVLLGAMLLSLGCSQAASTDTDGAADYADGWGPAVGSTLPALVAVDGSGMEQTLETLRGSKGLLLFLNRSADW